MYTYLVVGLHAEDSDPRLLDSLVEANSVTYQDEHVDQVSFFRRSPTRLPFRDVWYLV